MKKKLTIIILLIVAVILVVPIESHAKDGGTVKYNAVLWGVTKHHGMTFDSDGNGGYNTGTTIRILCFDVYSSYPKFVPMQKGA